MTNIANHALAIDVIGIDGDLDRFGGPSNVHFDRFPGLSAAQHHG